MSKFLSEFKSAMRGGHSFESGAVVSGAPKEDASMTHEDVEEIREMQRDTERELDEVKLTDKDIEAIGASRSVINVVGAVAQAATSTPPAQAEAFVSVGNQAIADAEKVLGVEIPRLSNDIDGGVDSASMEGLMGWFSSAAKAFKTAAERFFQRVALGWSRLNTSVKGMHARISKISSKVGGRAGVGGMPIKVSSSYLALMIKGNGYSQSLGQDIAEAYSIIEQFLGLAKEQHNRMDEFTKKAIFNVISENRRESFIDLHLEDIIKKADELLTKQPPLLLGNYRFIKADKGRAGITKYVLEQQVPYAKDLVKHLDAPMSLTNDQIKALLGQLQHLSDSQLKQVEEIDRQIEKSVANVMAAVARLSTPVKTAAGDHDYVEYISNIDDSAILRIENELVSELGTISEYISDLHWLMASMIDAGIALVEESVIQD